MNVVVGVTTHGGIANDVASGLQHIGIDSHGSEARYVGRPLLHRRGDLGCEDQRVVVGFPDAHGGAVVEAICAVVVDAQIRDFDAFQDIKRPTNGVIAGVVCGIAACQLNGCGGERAWFQTE